MLARKISFFDDFIALFFPRLCLACEKNIRSGEDQICLFCSYKLPKTDFHKIHENPVVQHFWGRVPIRNATAMFYFQEKSPVRKMMHQLKYKNKPEVGIALGKIYGKILAQEEVYQNYHLIIPVPLHIGRLRQRGYNQSAMFAIGLSESMQIPWKNSLERKLATQTQTRKTRLERFENVQHAFKLKSPKSLEGKRILLVDDVITTGATLEACALKLFEIPGIELSVVTIAFAK